MISKEAVMFGILLAVLGAVGVIYYNDFESARRDLREARERDHIIMVSAQDDRNNEATGWICLRHTTYECGVYGTVPTCAYWTCPSGRCKYPPGSYWTNAIIDFTGRVDGRP